MTEENTIPATAADVKPITTAPTQEQTFGKSELLDAGAILKDILGIKAGNIVGDLGAGGGMFTTQSAMIVGNQGQVYAVDVMKNILGEIESKARMTGLTNIKTIWSNLEMVGVTKIKEASLDFALLVNILFQSTKHFEILSEATRFLKPNGKLLIVDWSNTAPGFAPPSDRQVDPETIKQRANQLSLTLDQEFKAGNYHFGLVFIKA